MNLKKQLHQMKKNKKPPGNKEETTSNTQIKYVSTETLNLRKSPENNAGVVAQLSLNTEVIVEEQVDNTWSKVKVKSQGKEGYVASQFLSDEKTEISSRSENIDRNKANTLNDEKVETTTNEKTENSEAPKDTPSSSLGEEVVQYAKQYLGSKYVSGGTSPTTGFDCSGFTYYVFKHFGITLNRTSRDQISNGTNVERQNLKPGDLLIFNNSSLTAIGHVGIYIGGDTFIHAANAKKGVITTSLSGSYYSKRFVAARRIVN